MKQDDIIFYGDDFTPLSSDCYGCSNYGYICEGSVYMQECGAGIVEDMIPSIKALLVIKEHNLFVLARVLGNDIQSVIELDELLTPELQGQYDKALAYSEEEIAKIQKQYGSIQEEN